MIETGLQLRLSCPVFSGKRQQGAAPMKAVTMNGIRVVLMANRKGGSGKSTVCRALASAAAERGETGRGDRCASAGPGFRKMTLTATGDPC
ncbi:P-loop NTPase family protein [Rhodovulum strictum]|uniref:CobQ/CobB/MinD/ParA nucleotide binding domain-containing protein n=1 Tax=Rhodovulum strictum TaxID=58314 RepID=A0A844BPG3_9RHOB|nr:hypothetical protein [Rhodovulum strictum]MRH22872.1 hypothetical protein [Rhodovulum strictum]